MLPPDQVRLLLLHAELAEILHPEQRQLAQDVGLTGPAVGQKLLNLSLATALGGTLLIA